MDHAHFIRRHAEHEPAAVVPPHLDLREPARPYGVDLRDRALDTNKDGIRVCGMDRRTTRSPGWILGITAPVLIVGS